MVESGAGGWSRVISSLRNGAKPYIKTIPHRLGTEGKHYLTKRGKEVLVELCGIEEEQVRYPIGHIKTDTQDQFHRTTIIDLHILLDQHATKHGINVVFCDRYFDTTGSNRVARNLKSKTAIIYEAKKTLKADMTFIEKCVQHAKAIVLKSANEQYDHHKGYRTLWVFEHASTMYSVLRRLQTLSFFDEFREYFLFKSLAQCTTEADWFAGWCNLNQKERKMYY